MASSLGEPAICIAAAAHFPMTIPAHYAGSREDGSRLTAIAPSARMSAFATVDAGGHIFSAGVERTACTIMQGTARMRTGDSRFKTAIQPCGFESASGRNVCAPFPPFLLTYSRSGIVSAFCSNRRTNMSTTRGSGQAWWESHLNAIVHEGIGAKAYARREGLDVSSLYYWRRRIKAQIHGPQQPVRAASRLAHPTQAALGLPPPAPTRRNKGQPWHAISHRFYGLPKSSRTRQQQPYWFTLLASACSSSSECRLLRVDLPKDNALEDFDMILGANPKGP